MSSFLNNHKVRGLRNNNPGNLVRSSNAWQGKIPYPQSKDTKFEQFTELKWGIRAMFKDLINDINKGKNTVKKLIYEYAPPNENDTSLYIDKVCKSLGIGSESKISSVNNDFLKLLGRAIMKVELGNSHTSVTDDHLDDALAVLGNASLPNVVVVVSKTKTFLKKISPAIIFLALFFLAKYYNKQKLKTKFKKH